MGARATAPPGREPTVNANRRSPSTAVGVRVSAAPLARTASEMAAAATVSAHSSADAISV
jgi:hypothetical protein